MVDSASKRFKLTLVVQMHSCTEKHSSTCVALCYSLSICLSVCLSVPVWKALRAGGWAELTVTPPTDGDASGEEARLTADR